MRCFLIALLSTLPLQAQQPGPTPPVDRSRVSVNQVWTSLPDFVCNEKIVSSTLRKGKTKERRIIDSAFSAQRKEQTRADGTKVYSLIESREPIKIDGKPAPDGANLPRAPFFFDGLAANVLFLADSPWHHTSQAPSLDGRLIVRVAYTTRNSQEFTQLEFPAAVSDVQIDTQSLKALHVETRLGSLPGASLIPVSADFQSIEIDGNAYWLPRLMKAEMSTGKNETVTYSAEYTDCKKFEVRVQIRALTDEAPR